MSHVFISYSRKDTKVVGEFVESLRKQDFIVWQDVSDISAGDKWLDVILKAIDESSAFVIFWSQAASESEVVKKELDHALNEGKIVIPVWLEAKTPLGRLESLNAIATRGFSATASQKLAKALLKVAPRIQRKVSKFNPAISMGSQKVTGKKRHIYGNREYVVIPLVTSAYSNAVVIAEADVTVRDIKRVQIMVQNTRAADGSMIRDAFHAVLNEYENGIPPKEERLVGVYITGVLNKDTNQYMVDAENIAHYTDMLDTVLKAMQAVSQNAAQLQTFQLFLYTLVDIAFLLGVEINRWWPLQVYKKHGDTYVRIMNIPPRQP